MISPEKEAKIFGDVSVLPFAFFDAVELKSSEG
jgi:hypothetical protein